MPMTTDLLNGWICVCCFTLNLKVSALPNSSLPNVSWLQLLIVAGKNENLYGSKCVGRCLSFLKPFFTLFQSSPFLKILSVSTKVSPDNMLPFVETESILREGDGRTRAKNGFEIHTDSHSFQLQLEAGTNSHITLINMIWFILSILNYSTLYNCNN